MVAEQNSTYVACPGLALRDAVGAGGPVLVIAAQDREVVLALVVRKGGVVREPIGPSWRGRHFTFADPDGNNMVVWSEQPAPLKDP